MTEFFEGRPVQAGQFLNRELKRRKITQMRFAEMVDCDERTVRRWITGGINRVDVLFRIAAALELKNIGDFFSSEGEVPYVFVVILLLFKIRTDYALEDNLF